MMVGRKGLYKFNNLLIKLLLYFLNSTGPFTTTIIDKKLYSRGGLDDGYFFFEYLHFKNLKIFYNSLRYSNFAVISIIKAC